MFIEPIKPPIVAKRSQAAFAVRNNYYVIPWNGQFHYFPLEVEDLSTEAPIYRLEVSPLVLREGYAILNRNVYAVTFDDLMRRVIRKSRIVDIKKAKNFDGSPKFPTAAYLASPISSRGTSNEVSAESSPGTGIPGLGDEFEPEDGAQVEVRTRADVAWQEQVETLLHTLSEEEGGEWEIEEAESPGTA